MRRSASRATTPSAGTFTQSYGSKARSTPSTLLIPQVGFLPPTDPRVIGTVDAISRELTHDGFVLRYDTADAGDGLARHRRARSSPARSGSPTTCT